MNSITKCSPVFNVKTGILSYAWDELAQEKPLCPHCNNHMKYWYSRRRGVIISERKYLFMAPRFKCSCGKTITMHPYFIITRKQYSVFTIQEILNADISNDHSYAAAYGYSTVKNLRKWAVALVKGLLAEKSETFPRDERSMIHILYQQYGILWLSSILRKVTDSFPFSMPPPLRERGFL